MTHLKKRKSARALCTISHCYADKTLLNFVWFSEILYLSNYFQSPDSFKKEKIYFPTKYRGLDNG